MDTWKEVVVVITAILCFAVVTILALGALFLAIDFWGSLLMTGDIPVWVYRAVNAVLK